MTTPLWCLLGFGIWTIVLVLWIAVYRVSRVSQRKQAPNSFASGTPHGEERYWRVNRAHLNACENLPLIATVVLVGTVAGVTTPLFSTLAQVYLGARIAQSLIHIASNSNLAVNFRFGAYGTQLVCFLWMALEIARVAGA